jgi:hypothetical protein
MALMLRRQYVQDRIEGREPDGYSVDDYAVVDGTRIGRIWREVQNDVAKWLWSLQAAPAQPAESGIVDTLEQARAAVSKRWGVKKKAKKGG